MIETILSISQIIIGLLFFLFLPGYFAVKLFFNSLKIDKQYLLSVIFSIMIGLVIGVFFGYDRAQALRTGGFTPENIWVGELMVTAGLALFLAIRRIIKKQKLLKARKRKRSHKKRANLRKNKMASIKEHFQKFKENKGLYQFLVRSAILFGSLFVLYTLIFLWIRHMPFFIDHLRVDDGFSLSWLTGLRKTDFLNAGLFAVIGFIIWNRTKLMNLKAYVRNNTQTIIFAILSILFFVLHYVHKYWIGQNLVTAQELSGLMILLKYVLLFLFGLFAAFATYGKEFISYFFKKYYLSLLIFVGIGTTYFFLIQWFQLIWYQLSYFVSISIKGLLELTFNNVYFLAGSEGIGGPRLGANGFRVAISNECSGVDSLLLFLSLYSLLFILDYKRMHIKRMWALFIPGLIMTVAYNILRIYLLMLVGIFIDPKFAVDTFHTNIGWILFLVFFMIYWHFGSKWVYKKKKPEPVSKKVTKKSSKKSVKKTTKKSSSTGRKK